MKEQTPPTGRPPGPARARHGYRNEVNWEGGSARRDMPSGNPPRLAGRQPYANQGAVETPDPATAARNIRKAIAASAPDAIWNSSSRSSASPERGRQSTPSSRATIPSRSRRGRARGAALAKVA